MKASVYNNIFKNDEYIDTIKHYILTKQLPELQNPLPFIHRANEFTINKNHLVLKKTGQIVIPSTEKDKILTKLYNNIKEGAGKGITSFYKLVIQKYINIKRSDVADFLKHQTYYQLEQPLKHVINKPIVSTYPNQIYCIDLIDMGEEITKSNYKNRYILTIVDAFSSKTWLGKLTNRTALSVAKQFEKVVPIYPTYILCDNGNEFKAEFQEFCDENEIKIRRTATYSPQSNGIAEGKNRQIRKLIRDLFIRHGNKVWSTYLNEIADNLNNTYNRRKKATPNQLWSAALTHIPMPKREMPDYMLNPQQKEVKRMLHNQKLYDDKVLEKGDYVRVKMTALYSDIRRLVKENNHKQIVVNYSPDVYQITKRVKPRNSSKYEYYLENMTNHNKPNRSFFLSDLEEIPKAENDTQLTIHKAMKLNGAKLIPENDNIQH